MNTPSKFNAVPALVQQLAESAAYGITPTHKNNARQTLELIKDYIEYMLKHIPEPTAGKR